MSGGATTAGVGGNVRFAGHTPYHPRFRAGGGPSGGGLSGGPGGLAGGGGDGGLRGRGSAMGGATTPHPASAADDRVGADGGIGVGTGANGNVEGGSGVGVGGGSVGRSVPPDDDDDDGFDFAPPPRASTMTGSVRGGGVVGGTLGGVGHPPSSPSRATTTDARTTTGARTGTANLPVVEPEEEVIDDGGEDLTRWVVVYGFPTTVSERHDRDDGGEGDDDNELDVDTGLTEIATTVLRRFEGYGEVTGRRVASLRRPGAGGAKSGSGSGAAVTVRPNWIALRYASVLQAEKALCQNGTMIFGGGGARGGDPSNLMFVGVKRMDPATARVIFGGAASGRGRAGGSGTVDVPAPPPPPRAAPVPPCREADGSAAATEEDVLLLRPSPGALEGGRPPRGLLAMFLAWIFNW